jgi:hypothetical protein
VYVTLGWERLTAWKLSLDIRCFWEGSGRGIDHKEALP